MGDLMRAKTVSVSIAAAPTTVYEYAADPEHLPEWAPAFCRSVEYSDEGWIVRSPDGPVGIEFAAENPYGVLDHTVTPGSGGSVYIPMRVIPNGSGSEVLLTMFQPPDMDDQRFADDAAMVTNDLLTLKLVIEGRDEPPGGRRG